MRPTTPVSSSIPRPQTEDELRAVLARYLGVVIPDVQVCAGHSTPWRAFCDAYFARAPWVVWHAARGMGGKSYALAILGWIESVTLGAGVNILGGSGEQSKRVHEYLRGFWNKPGAPAEMLISDPSKFETRLTNGAKVTAGMASQRWARGAHEPRLRLDEVDEMDESLIDAVRGQPISTPTVLSNIVFSSTLQYPDGPMTHIMREAVDRGAPIHRWCFRESMAPHGWLTEEAVARYRATVSAELWRVEVELGEPSPEGRAVLSEFVDRMFVGELRAVQDWEYLELEPPIAGARYATGCDWGKRVDRTCIWTWRADVTPMRLVAYERGNRRPWPWMFGRLTARIRRYPGDAAHDRLGVGDTASDMIDAPCEDFEMVGKRRSDLFMNYITAIERGDVQAPRLRPAYDAHRFTTQNDLFGTGHPPDDVVAAALAYHAAARVSVGLVMTREMPRSEGYLAGLLTQRMGR